MHKRAKKVRTLNVARILRRELLALIEHHDNGHCRERDEPLQVNVSAKEWIAGETTELWLDESGSISMRMIVWGFEDTAAITDAAQKELMRFLHDNATCRCCNTT